jgi:hypothetical protein
MEDLGGGTYRFSYLSNFVPGNMNFYYQIVAYDTTNPPNISDFPGYGTWWDVPIQTVAAEDNIVPMLAEGIRSVYPNPFMVGKTASLRLSFYTQKSAPLVWKIFNIKGQLVYEQHSSSTGKGLQELSWNGKDMRGNMSTSGVYLVEFSIGENSYKHKLLMSK